MTSFDSLTPALFAAAVNPCLVVSDTLDFTVAIKNKWDHFFKDTKIFYVFALVKDIEQLPKLSIRGVIMPRDPMSGLAESFSASDVIDFLDAHRDDKEILVEISSNGGSVSEGMEIFNRLRQSGKKITTITHKANSIAALLMLAGTKRLIVEGGGFMIHAARVHGEDMAVLGELTSEDLDKIADEVRASTVAVLDMFCKILGEDKRTALIAAMAQNTNLGSREAIKLGFAQGYYKKIEPVNEFESGIMITDHLTHIIQNRKNMKTDQSSAIETILKDIQMSIKTLFKSNKIKNELIVKTSDGTQYYVEVANPDDPTNLVGAKVSKLDEAGAQSGAADDGEYTIEDGSTLVIKGGVVTEVKPAVLDNKEVEALNAKLAEKEAEIVALKTDLEAKNALLSSNTTQITEMSKKFDLLDKQFKSFKDEVPGDKGGEKEKKKPEQKDFSKMSLAERNWMVAKEKRERSRQGK